MVEDQITVSAQGIKDFQTCPRLFEYRHVNKDPEPIHAREMMALRYKNTLRKLLTYFFYKQQGGTIPSYSALLNRWEKLWFPKDTTTYDLMVSQNSIMAENTVSYSNLAAKSLLQLHNQFSNLEGDPIIVGQPFIVSPISKIRLEGNIDLAVRLRDKTFIFMWRLLERKTRPTLDSCWLDLAVIKSGFQSSNLSNPDFVANTFYIVYDVSRESADPMMIPITDDHVEQVNYWLELIRDDDIRPHRRGLIKECKTCNYDKPCRQWSIKNAKKARVDG